VRGEKKKKRGGEYYTYHSYDRGTYKGKEKQEFSLFRPSPRIRRRLFSWMERKGEKVTTALSHQKKKEEFCRSMKNFEKG